MGKMSNRTKGILLYIAGWALMVVPVVIYLGFNFNVFTPAKVSALLMVACLVIGFSWLNKFKNIGGTICIFICIFMLVMRSDAWFVTAIAIGIAGVSNLIASLSLFPLAKMYLRRAKNG